MNSRNSHRLIPSMLMAAACGLRSIRFEESGDAGATPPNAQPDAGDSFSKMREEFSRLQDEGQQVIEGAAKENRDLNDKEKADNQKRFDRMKTIKGTIDERLKFAKMQLETDPQGVSGHVQTAKPMPGQNDYQRSEGRGTFGDDEPVFDEKAYRSAMKRFTRTGQISKELQFAVISTTDSGAYLPKQVLPAYTVRRLGNAWRGVLAAYGVMPIETTSMASFSLPVGDDTANTGQAQTESATSGTALDPSQAGLLMSPTLYSSKQFWYSNTMVLTGAFDVLGYTLPMAQKRVDKIQESAWTTAILATGTVGKTLASPTALTYAEWIAWEHSLAASYRTDAAFVLSDSCYQAVRGLVDSNNRPIIDLDPTNNFVGKIHGKPIIICDYLQTMIANKTVGAFVSADAIKIVDVMNARLARYSNESAHPDQIGFELFQNGDMKFIPAGVSLLKTAIS